MNPVKIILTHRQAKEEEVTLIFYLSVALQPFLGPWTPFSVS
jgi:hypothetical protein